MAFDQLSFLKSVANGEKIADAIEEQLAGIAEISQEKGLQPAATGYGKDIAIACKSFGENSLLDIYHPIVKFGECANILCDCRLSIFAEYVSKAFGNKHGKIGHFWVNIEECKTTKILCIDPDTGDETIPFVDFRLVNKGDELQFIENYAKTQGIRIVEIWINVEDVPDLQTTARALEDLAERCKIALLVCWQYDESNYPRLYEYMSKHGHNVCSQREITCKDKSYIMFDWGGIKPKLIILYDSPNGIKADKDFNEKFRAWCFAYVHDKYHPDEYVPANQYKNRFIGFCGNQMAERSASSFITAARRYKIVSQKGKSNHRQYKYDAESEKQFEP